LRVRTFIVGNVHGCSRELEALLDRAVFTSGDHLVFVGDIIARGPDSLGVLDIARCTGATLVRGNHEQRLLDWKDSLDKNAPRADRSAAGTDRKHRIARNVEDLNRDHETLGRALRPVDWTLLKASRLFVDLPEHGIRVVHAGVVPGVALADQTPDTFLRIRSVRIPMHFTSMHRSHENTRASSRSTLWGAVYTGPPHIVFGHNAAPGLQLHPWATGLDTGCVYGQQLTALVLEQGEQVPRSIAMRRRLLITEPAQRVWYPPRRTPAPPGTR